MSEEPEETTSTEQTTEATTEVAKEETTAAAETTTETTEPVKEETVVPAWSDNWHDEVAKEFAGDDEKAFEKHKKNLSQFYKDPTDMYRRLREQDEYIRGGGLVKVPGKDASDDEVAAYHKAIGVPESPDEYLDKVELSDGVQLGDADKVVAKAFADEMHSSGLTQAQMNKAMDWYFKANTQQETAMVEMDEADKKEAEKSLHETYGAKRKSVQTAILNSFKGNTELHDKIMDGRLADGTLIKNSPDVIAYLQNQVFQANPTAAAIVEGQANGVSVTDEIKDIEKLMRTDRKAYNKDEKIQARYRELLEIQQGMSA